MTAVHLVNPYCIPSLLYGCEIFYFKSSDHHELQVIWNNAFRKMFQCCWRESVTCLLYCRKAMPCTVIYDRSKGHLVSEKNGSCNNCVERSISAVNTCAAKISKYSLRSLHYSPYQIEEHMWKHFVDSSVVQGKLSVCVCFSVFTFHVFLCVSFYRPTNVVHFENFNSTREFFFFINHFALIQTFYHSRHNTRRRNGLSLLFDYQS